MQVSYPYLQVGDEVLVSFAHGDFGQPYVLGGLWNGQHDLPPEVGQAGSGKKPRSAPGVAPVT